MKYLLLLISLVFVSCSSKIYLNPDYSGKIKDKSLAIVDMYAYSDLLSRDILDSLTYKPGDIILSPPLKGAIQRQSYFSMVNYARVNTVNNFELYKVDLPEKKLHLFLPKKGETIQMDSSGYDFVMFAYAPYDTSNESDGPASLLLSLFLPLNESVVHENLPVDKMANDDHDIHQEQNVKGPKIELADKYFIDDLTFVIWDNKKGAIVNYGSFDKIWEESYKEVIYETARMILIKSPFYKPLPPR